jgi:hypothetical protein
MAGTDRFDRAPPPQSEEDPDELPGQEPLQDPRHGSTIESVPGPMAIACHNLTRGMVCLNTSNRPQKPAQNV